MNTVAISMQSLVRELYDRVLRPHLPKKIGVMNGVAVRNRALFDRTDIDLNYEDSSITPLTKYVTHGDDVLILGGGYGVTAVRAARNGGDVIVVEGAYDYAQKVRETASLNKVNDRIEVIHAVVGDGYDVWGEPGKNLAPDELPECNVLEMDVQGSERSILPRLKIRPRILIIEAHPTKGAGMDWVARQVVAMGYSVVSRRQHGSKNGAGVVTAEKHNL